MAIVSPDELLEKLTPEEEEEYKYLEEQINESLRKEGNYPCKETKKGWLFCRNVDLFKIPPERVLKKINEEAKKSGWGKVTLEESNEGSYLQFWPKED